MPNRKRLIRAWALHHRQLRAGGVVIYLAGTTALLFWLFSGWAYDDPFISYRYAHNLADGAGFVYNPGERILSTTTVLFVLLLASILKLFPLAAPYLPLIANLISAFCLACGGLFLWDLTRVWKTPASAWAALLLYPAFPWVTATLGSEMPLYIALCLAALSAMVHGRSTWAAALAALATLTRPDGILVAIVLTAAALNRRLRKTPPAEVQQPVQSWLSGLNWRPPVAFSLILLPWVGYAWMYFGSPVPVTLAAKQLQGSMSISQRFLPGLAELFANSLSRPYFICEALLAVVGIIFSIQTIRQGGKIADRTGEAPVRLDGFWLVWLWLGAYGLGYTLLGVSRYSWYYAPLAVGWILSTSLGVEAMAAAWCRRRSASASSQAWPAALVLVLVFALEFQALLQVRQNADRRMPVFRQAGEWLRTNTPSGSTVGTLEIGVIGYYSERPVIDFAGLIQPEVGRRLPGRSTYEGAARWAVRRYKPDFIVLREQLFPVLESDYIAHKCRAVQTFPADAQGYPWQITIYSCVKAGA